MGGNKFYSCYGGYSLEDSHFDQRKRKESVVYEGGGRSVCDVVSIRGSTNHEKTKRGEGGVNLLKKDSAQRPKYSLATGRKLLGGKGSSSPGGGVSKKIGKRRLDFRRGKGVSGEKKSWKGS